MNDQELDSVLAQIAPAQLPTDLLQRTMREFDRRNSTRRLPLFSWKLVAAIVAGVLVVSLSAFAVATLGQRGSAVYSLPDGNVLLVSDTFTPKSLRSWVWAGLWHQQSEMSKGELQQSWTMWGRKSLSLGYSVLPRPSQNGQYDLAFAISDTRSVENQAFEVSTGFADTWIPLPAHEVISLDQPFEFRVAGVYTVRLTISHPVK